MRVRGNDVPAQCVTRVMTMRKESHVNWMWLFPSGDWCTWAASESDSRFAHSRWMNHGWIRPDCVFPIRIHRHTSIDSLHFICFIQLACMTYDVCEANDFSGIRGPSIAMVEIWKRITLTRQSLIERCVKQANSVIAADTTLDYLIEKCIKSTNFLKWACYWKKYKYIEVDDFATVIENLNVDLQW